MEYLSYEGLKTYDTLIKGYIDTGDDNVSTQAKNLLDIVDNKVDDHEARLQSLEDMDTISIEDIDNIVEF